METTTRKKKGVDTIPKRAKQRNRPTTLSIVLDPLLCGASLLRSESDHSLRLKIHPIRIKTYCMSAMCDNIMRVIPDSWLHLNE